MSELYAAGVDPYCYPGSSVLRNNFDIHDAQLLADVESLYSQQRLAELYTDHPVAGRFGLTHLSRIHRFIFQDVYPWAGKLRTVRIHKGQTTFAYPEHIQSEADRIFSALHREKLLQDLPLPVLIERLAWYVGEMNVLHPFREGNGRTLRAFLRELLLQQGLWLRFEELNSEEWLQASIAAYSGDLLKMQALLARILEPLK
ncbi:MAG TPA: Fic family protein [Negativicutes bacterium]|nr:Fic family protein [Negativicutes bacterium]